MKYLAALLTYLITTSILFAQVDHPMYGCMDRNSDSELAMQDARLMLNKATALGDKVKPELREAINRASGKQ